MAAFPGEPCVLREAGLLESALNRPAWEAHYRQASIARQAATLLWGLVKNQCFEQGNKRTATVALEFILRRLGYQLNASQQEKVDLAFDIVGGMSVDDVEQWMNQRIVTVRPAPFSSEIRQPPTTQ